jgi:hypothetical protein
MACLRRQRTAETSDAPVALSKFVGNHQHAGLWPSWMPPQRYGKVLRRLSALTILAIAPATYAWTVLNLGTSALTTNIAPRQEYLWAWRGYLSVVILAALAFPSLPGPMDIRLTQQKEN